MDICVMAQCCRKTGWNGKKKLEYLQMLSVCRGKFPFNSLAAFAFHPVGKKSLATRKAPLVISKTPKRFLINPFSSDIKIQILLTFRHIYLMRIC